MEIVKSVDSSQSGEIIDYQFSNPFIQLLLILLLTDRPRIDVFAVIIRSACKAWEFNTVIG